MFAGFGLPRTYRSGGMICGLIRVETNFELFSTLLGVESHDGGIGPVTDLFATRSARRTTREFLGLVAKVKIHEEQVGIQHRLVA